MKQHQTDWWISVISLGIIILFIAGIFFIRFHFVCNSNWSCMLADKVVYVKDESK